MSKTRIHELAKELNITTKDLIDSAHSLGYDVKNHMSTLEEGEISKLKGRFMKKASDTVETKPAEKNSAQTPKVENKPAEVKSSEVSEVKPAGEKPAGEKHHKIIYDRTKEIREEENRRAQNRSSHDNKNYNRNNDNRSYDNRNAGSDNRQSGERKPYNPNYQKNDYKKPYESKTEDTRIVNKEGSTTDTRRPSDRPQSDRPQSDRPQSDRPYEKRPYDPNRQQSDRPYEKRPYDPNRPQSDRPYEKRPYDPNRPQSDRPYEKRPYDPNRPQSDRPYEKRPYDPNRPQSDRPYEKRPYDPNRPKPDRPYEKRPYDPNRPQSDRPYEKRPYDPNRPQSDRPYEKRPYDPNRPKPAGGYNKPSGGFGSGGFNKDKDKDYSGPSRKSDSSSKNAFPASEIAEKNPKKKKQKKDKIVVTFDTDRLETKSKKAKKLLKEEIIVSEVDPRREFDFGKKVKQKSGKYKEKRDEERSDKLNEILTKEKVFVPAEMTVKEYAEVINKPVNDIILKLIAMGNMATLNKILDFETAAMIAIDYDIELEVEEVQEVNQFQAFDLNFEDDPKDLKKRAPVVTVMGHVDHGKTSLLDAIRNTGVASGEAGGITQHIGASEVMHNGEKILFLDTPGHEAFTSLRARGAKVTDIAILVVAADDGVMPQTIEAIDHSKAAKVPIIVAINKMDKPNANPDRVKQELSDRGLIIEEWGGDVIAVPVSAKTGEGLDKLLEMVLLVSEVLELKANPNRPGIGTVIEAKVVKGRGTVASIILEKGTMSVGDPIVAGTAFGKVKAMYNNKEKKVKQIGPSTTVEIDGLNEVPQAGEKIYVTPDEKVARTIAERHAVTLREKTLNKNPGVTLEDIFSRIKDGAMKELNIIVKADVHGSVEAIKQSLQKISNDEVRVSVIRADVGAISESDVILASASSAIIIGFNVRPSANVSMIAEQEGVDIRTYQIIYNAINDVETAMKGMLDPLYKEVILGRAQVRQTFKIPSGVIAGAYITSGKVQRNAQVRVIREGIVIFEGKLNSLKRFKDDVKEVAQGYECGLGVEKFNDLKEDDEIEAFFMEEVKR